MSTKHLPIGIFDSGLGGLTVLKALAKALPQENFLYLGDTARLPYGSKSKATIQNYLKQNIAHLLGVKVKALVVACNSASTHVDESLISELPVPLLEVIHPGARVAAQASECGRIGVIGTHATIQGQAYVSALKAINPKLDVFQQVCPLFVPLVEEGWVDDPLTNLVAYRYISPLLARGIDTLILGCTHYPVLKKAISKVVGPQVNLVDSGEAMADRLIQAMNGPEQKIEANPFTQHAGQIHIQTTDNSPFFKQVAERILAPVPLDHLEHVDLITSKP